MSYTTLYRKYRPAVFEDVKGQDPIVTALRNQIRAGRIGHAYLFCGTRGTGKTTVAKIFAKAVNCEHPADGSPCGECRSCRAIAAGTSMNVIEIDAASNNGVDNIREIREEVEYAPTDGKYRVYIIDEVHMLSAGAFNALLKTLEEPPSYVIFILATTEPYKIPVTILSRCQRYDFRRISADTIADRLRELAKKEGVEAEEKALRQVAKAADGSMRDALSLLDQCLAFHMGQRLTYENVLDVLGSADTEVFSRLLQALLESDAAEALRVLDEVIMQGRDAGQFVRDFIWHLRNLLLLQNTEDAGEMIDVSEENLQLLKEEAQAVPGATLMRYIRVLSELSDQLRHASQKRVLIEVALIRLCRPETETSQDALEDRVRKLEREADEGVFAVRAGADPAPAAAPAGSHEKPEMPDALPEDIEKLIRSWDQVLDRLYPPFRKCFENTSSIGLEMGNDSDPEAVDLEAGQGNELILTFQNDRDSRMRYNIVYKDTQEEKKLEKIFSEVIGKKVRLMVKLNDDAGPLGDSRITVEDMTRKFFEDRGVEVEEEDE